MNYFHIRDVEEDVVDEIDEIDDFQTRGLRSLAPVGDRLSEDKALALYLADLALAHIPRSKADIGLKESSAS